MSTHTPLCVAYKLSRFGVLDDLRTRKMDPDKLAHNYVRLYLHASVSVYTVYIRRGITKWGKWKQNFVLNLYFLFILTL